MGTQIITDTFTESAYPVYLEHHLAETEENWVSRPLTPYYPQASLEVESSGGGRVTGLRGGGNSAALYYITAVPPTTDYAITATLYTVTSLGFGGIAAKIGTKSPLNFYCAGFLSSGYTLSTLGEVGPGWGIWRFVGGSGTRLAFVSAVDLLPSSSYALEFRVGASGLLELYVDSVLKCSVTDTAITAKGRSGLFLWDSHRGDIFDPSVQGFRLDSFGAVAANNCAAGGADADPTSQVDADCDESTDLGKMRCLWRELTNERSSTAVPDTAVDRYLQLGLEAFNGQVRYHWTDDSSSITLVSGTGEYTLPDAAAELAFVVWNGEVLKKADVDEWRRVERDWRTATGAPQEWAVYGRKLVLRAIPDDAAVAVSAVVTLRYVSSPRAIGTYGPEQLEDQHLRLPVLYGAAIWFQSANSAQPDLAAGFLREFAQGAAEAAAFYASRRMRR